LYNVSCVSFSLYKTKASLLPSQYGDSRLLTNSKAYSTDVQEGADCLVVARIVRESGKEPRRQVI
jgi:hypothetical protein